VNPAAKLIRGQVMHDRMRPRRHRFVYPVFYVRVNLARLSELNSAWFGVDRYRLASIRTRDYGARDGSDLQSWMRAILQDAGIAADGEIWLQTFPRLFGFVFNPVSFWYCYDRSGALRAVLAEVNNTFGQSHRYLLSADGPITADVDIISNKDMHVSPFCRVEGFYCFKFRETENSSLVSLDYYDESDLLIKTTVGGRAEALTSRNMLGAILRQPFLTLSIVAGIHWQALRLWIKGVRFYSNPGAADSYLTRSLTLHRTETPSNQKEPTA